MYTKIPEELLAKKRTLDYYEVSSRMAWASERETTRTEVMAYCLIGVFDVNMPLLYGEGEKAFQRLQEVILRQRPDLSILGWHGWTESGVSLRELGDEICAEKTDQSSSEKRGSTVPNVQRQPYFSELLARSPKRFVAADPDQMAVIDESIEFSITQQGLVMSNEEKKLEIMEFGQGTSMEPMRYWFNICAVVHPFHPFYTSRWISLQKIAPGIFALDARKKFISSGVGMVSSCALSKFCLVMRPTIDTIARAVEARKWGIRVPLNLLPGFLIRGVRPQSHWDASDRILFRETQRHGSQAVFALLLAFDDETTDQEFVILFDPHWWSFTCKVSRVSSTEDHSRTSEWSFFCSRSFRQVFRKRHQLGPPRNSMARDHSMEEQYLYREGGRVRGALHTFGKTA